MIAITFCSDNHNTLSVQLHINRKPLKCSVEYNHLISNINAGILEGKIFGKQVCYTPTSRICILLWLLVMDTSVLGHGFYMLANVFDACIELFSRWSN